MLREVRRELSLHIKKQTHRYTGYMALMTKEVDSQSMVGKNRSSKQVSQKEVGKSSNAKGAAVAAENLVVLETYPGG